VSCDFALGSLAAPGAHPGRALTARIAAETRTQYSGSAQRSRLAAAIFARTSNVLEAPSAAATFRIGPRIEASVRVDALARPQIFFLGRRVLPAVKSEAVRENLLAYFGTVCDLVRPGAWWTDGSLQHPAGSRRARQPLAWVPPAAIRRGRVRDNPAT
jgi:hypothetical protein